MEDERDTLVEKERERVQRLEQDKDLWSSGTMFTSSFNRVWVLSTWGSLFVECNTLYGFPQVIAMPLFIDHMLLYLPSGDVVVLIKINIQEPFIITKV